MANARWRYPSNLEQPLGQDNLENDGFGGPGVEMNLPLVVIDR